MQLDRDGRDRRPRFLRCFFDALFDAIDIDRKASPKLVEHYDAFVESSLNRIDRLQREGSAAIGDITMFSIREPHRQHDVDQPRSQGRPDSVSRWHADVASSPLQKVFVQLKK